MLNRLFVFLIIAFFSNSLIAQKSEVNLLGDPSYEILGDQFEAFTVFEFDTRAILNQRKDGQLGFLTSFSIGSTYDWELVLEPNQIKADNYRLTIANEMGTFQGFSSPDIHTFGGLVVGTDYDVRLTIMEDFLYGYIETGDDAIFIEPLRYFIDGVAQNLFVAYPASAVKEHAPKSCAVNEMHKRGKHLQNHKEQNAQRMVGNCYELEIAYANDLLMFNAYGSVAGVEAHNTAVLNNVQGNYDDEFSDEIQFLIVEIFVPTTAAQDPFTSSTNPNTLLDDFTSWGPSGFSATHDIGALWTNRNLDGGTIGLAWVGTVCSGFRYHIMEDFSSSAAFLRVLHAHEMGHNFSFSHDGSGGFIMSPTVNSSTIWSTQSQNQFDSYITTIDPPNGCLVVCPPPVPPVALFSPDNNVVCQGSFVTFYDQSQNSPTSWSWNMPGATPSTSTEKSPTVQYNSLGSYNVTLTVTNANGSNSITLTGVVNVVPAGGTDVFFYEGFESGAGQFTVENPDNSTTWSNTSVDGTREGTKAMFVDNYDYNAAGQEDALVSPVLDFTGRSNTELIVEYAYKRYDNQYKDSLKVLISTNGGSTYTTIFADTENGSGNFATGPQSTTEFFPSANTDWCFATTYGPGCLTVDLSAYDGLSNIKVKIVNKTGYGNNMFVDNIRFSSSCVVINPPVAAFTAIPSSGCAPLTVNFLDQSTNSPTSWAWNFPGGTPATSTQQNPTVLYSTPGTYSVTLTAINPAGSDVTTINNIITVEDAPDASFTAVNNNGTVDFTNTSTGSITTYDWDFGDGNGSALENPSHTYANDGTYTVVLVVTGPCGVDAIQQTIFVESLPVAGFSALETEICAGDTVSFVDESTNNVIAWDWSFPGGTPTTSDVANPQIVYNTPGVYSVTLTVSSTLGDDTFTQTDYITVSALPVANFTSVTNINTVDFTNTSTDADTYAWDFGDGNFSSDSDPSHTYAADGTYTVELIASNACASDTITQEIVLSSLPTAGIGSDITAGCLPVTVNFEDLSSGNTTSWAWTFEGGTPNTSTSPNPVVDYDQVGTYDVTLIATNANGSDTLLLEDYIEVLDIPNADFSSAINGQVVSLTNLSTNADSYLWTFGDGGTDTSDSPTYDYGADGTYSLTLIASNLCGSDTLTELITIATLPTAGILADNQGGCLPVTIQFEEDASPNTQTWSWTFEGGTPATSDVQDPIVTYDQAGIFDVQLIVSNGVGSDTLVLADYVEILPLPVPDFTAANSGLDVTFTNNSQDATSYFWEFGDAQTSTATDPVHTYGSTGTYDVSLYAINSCDTVILTETIVVSLGPPAVINADVVNGCADLTVQFDDGGVPDVDAWSWTFEGGNPATSSVQNPIVVYETPGIYDVTLTVSNANGSTTLLLEDYIEVFSEPLADFSFVTANDQVDFTNLSLASDSQVWDFGDGNDSTEENPTHTYSADGTYAVMLIASGICGSDTLIQDVLIVTPPTAGFEVDTNTVCIDGVVQYTSTSSSNTTTYNWTFEGGTPSSSSEQNPLVTYSASGLYDVELIVSNTAGSDTINFQEFITVQPDASADFTANVNLGAVDFTNQSVDADNYSWFFGDGGTSNEVDPTHVYNEDGTYEVLLIASNACGSDSVIQLIDIFLPPVAGFDVAAQVGCTPFEVPFSNTSSANATAFEWIFEGGTPSTSTEENPVVIYDQAGTYPVTLIVTNTVGTDTLTIADYITVALGGTAGFDFVVNGTEVVFTNNSTNANTYEWAFGDGAFSSETNPTHIYDQDGLYTVVLTVENDCETLVVEQQILISVGAPIALFSYNQDSYCLPATVSFVNESSANSDSYLWVFPGGSPSTSTDENPFVTYASPGFYSVTLIASNGNGEGVYELTNEIEIYDVPTAGFDYTVSGYSVVFENTSIGGETYFWDFGDGVGTSNMASPSYNYGEVGNYPVVLTVMNPCDTVSTSVEVVIDATFPTAFFSADPLSGCAPMLVSFQDLSSQNVDTWSWEFEGGAPATSNEQNPDVLYQEPGEFNVTLTVSNILGSNTIQFTNYISVGKAPEASFSYQPGSVGGIQFNNFSENATSYAWDFGDGNSSSGTSPLHIYDASGIYQVELVASNECGSDTFTTEVQYIPVAVEEVLSVDYFEVYPNPSLGEYIMKVQMSDYSTEALSIRVVDLTGRMIYDSVLELEQGYVESIVDLQSVASGVYVLEISGEKQRLMKKLIKL